MKAIGRSLRIAPRKMNLIAELVRNKKVIEAMNILSFTPKKAAKILNKVISGAVANAENNFKQDKDTLFIKEIIVTKAPTFKRSVPISRGRVYPILKRNSHVTVMIGVLTEQKPAATSKTRKAAETETPKKEEVKTKKTTKSRSTKGKTATKS